jgi:hypothetical protein
MKIKQNIIEKELRGKTMNIKKWYLDTYNDDEGENINENATFEEMDYYEIRHIYEYLGDGIDSIIRERVFEKLASLLNMKYEEIYDIWLS